MKIPQSQKENYSCIKVAYNLRDNAQYGLCRGISKLIEDVSD